MAAILIFGAAAYLKLPVSALPEVEYPTIQVRTFYPGASPDVMSSAVTAPLERQFGQIPGLTQNLPASVKLTVLTDRTTRIRASVNNVRVRAHAYDRPGRDSHLHLSA